MVFNMRGTVIAAKIMMMTATMIISIREKPRSFFRLVECSILRFERSYRFADMPRPSVIVGAGRGWVKARRCHRDRLVFCNSRWLRSSPGENQLTARELFLHTGRRVLTGGAPRRVRSSPLGRPRAAWSAPRGFWL